MTTKTPWAHLPNAKHIAAVLADVRERPEAWDAASHAAWDAAWGAAWNAAWGAALDAERGAAWDVITALIAWDSSAA